MARITRKIAAVASALTVVSLASPALANWQVARTEEGLAAYTDGGKPAVGGIILACRKGQVNLLVKLELDPERTTRQIGFRGYTSTRESLENFSFDPKLQVWVTVPSAATMALLDDEEFTLQVTLGGMPVSGISLQGYDGKMGVRAAKAQVLAACPRWKPQGGGVAAAPAPVRPPPPAPAPPPAPRPAAAPAAASQAGPPVAPLGIAAGHYVTEGQSCSAPEFEVFYYDGKRFALLRGHGKPGSMEEDFVGPLGKVSRYKGQLVLDEWDMMIKVLSPTRFQPTIQDTAAPMRWCPASQLPVKFRMRN